MGGLWVLTTVSGPSPAKLPKLSPTPSLASLPRRCRRPLAPDFGLITSRRLAALARFNRPLAPDLLAF